MGLSVMFLLQASCGASNEVPVYGVSRGRFVHKVTAEGTLKAKESTKITVPPTVRRRVRLAWVAPEGTLLEEGDVVARFDGREFEINLEEAQADLSETNQDVTKTRAESDVKLGEHRRDYEVAELELGFAEQFDLSDKFVFSRREIAEDAIDEELAGARRDHARDMSEIQEELARTELEILGIEKRKSTIRIDDAKTGLSSLEVTAPHRGILTLSRNWRGETVAVGTEMWRGQEIGEIPALGTMEAEVFVLEADAGGVAAGQTAVVVVESNPEIVHATKVSRMEAVAKPRFRGSPVQYFGVTLEFAGTDTEMMKPGQRVVATLVLDQREEVFVVPRQAVFQEGDSYWVYQRGRGSFSATPVEVGGGSAALVVVESGLEEGDVIALAKPLAVDQEPPFGDSRDEPGIGEVEADISAGRGE
jgi:multidrug efflux pump subunit AcrA (membrane-fusion protein)